jgi:Tol biopolymer transport system component
LIAAATITIFLLRQSVPSYQSRALTSYTDSLPIESAAISPDGQHVAYAQLDKLYVRATDLADDRRLDTPQNLDPTCIDWFSDNEHLLVSGSDAGADHSLVWSISILGGQPIVLVQNATNASVSPKGDLIAFIRDNAVWTAAADGSEPRKISQAANEELFVSRPRFSPAGTHLLIGKSKPGTPHVRIDSYPLDGGDPVPVYQADAYVIDFAVLPSNELLLSELRGFRTTSTQLISMRIDPASGAKSRPQPIVEWPDFASYHLTATRDGSQVVFVKDGAQPDVYVGDIDAHTFELSNVRRVTLDQSRDGPSGWLNEQTVLFHSNRTGIFGLYAQEIDTNRAHALVPVTQYETWPVLSPDRTKVFALRWPKAGAGFADNELVAHSLQSGTAEVLDTTPNEARALRCALNGSRCVTSQSMDDSIAFLEFDPQLGRTGRELARVKTKRGYYFSWALSPEGDRLAALLLDQPDAITWFAVSKPSDRHVTRLSAYESLESVTWDTTGKGFFVTSHQGNRSALLHVTLDGKVRVLRRQAYFADTWALPSPEGTHLAFSDWTPAGNIWMLTRKK